MIICIPNYYQQTPTMFVKTKMFNIYCWERCNSV